MAPISTKRTRSARAPQKAALERLFRAAVDAVAPEDLVSRRLYVENRHLIVGAASGEETGRWPLPARVFGAGKAAARMARGCQRVLGEDTRGLVIVAEGCETELTTIETATAGHPLPDVRGLAATERLLRQASEVSSRNTVLFLLSGGASSLLVRPRAPLTLEDKIAVNELLLASGASIREVNLVRKHLSEVKGGGFVRHCQAQVVALILSDVIGDDPAVIASGPTAPDPTTFDDALEVLERFQLRDRVPATVLHLLEAGARGEVPETLKPSESIASRAVNAIVGSNRLALEAAEDMAQTLGWTVVRVREPLDGDTGEAARRFGQLLRAELGAARVEGKTRCVLAGGETTVQLRGAGKGGRNQEFALALAPALADASITVLSAGSDGIDGPTDVAGAFADGTTLERARRLGLDPAAALAHNDSYPFFHRLRDHFRPGPTGTNVMDLKLAVVEA